MLVRTLAVVGGACAFAPTQQRVRDVGSRGGMLRSEVESAPSAPATTPVETAAEEESATSSVEDAGAAAEAPPPPITSVRNVRNSDDWYNLALPFQNRPKYLDGTLAADSGFDPCGLVTSRVDLYNFREAEIKHARLAMLCAAGWPLGELWDDGLASTFNLPSIVAQNGGRDPSLLNGGLQLISPVYWLSVLALTGAIEYVSETRKEQAKAADKNWMMTGSWVPGDLGFDPFGLYTALGPSERGKFLMETAELKNGRLAMIAVLTYVVEEFVTGKPVVEISPIFFRPFWKIVEEVMIGSPALYGQ